MTDYTDDRTLADALVEMEILRVHAGQRYSYDKFSCHPYKTVTAKTAVREPRVAIALMQKVETGEFVQLENGLWAVGIPLPKTNREATCEHESLCRAITQACIEALTHDDKTDG